MSEQNQLWLKLFLLYAVLFGAMTMGFNYLMGYTADFWRSAPLFLLVAGYLSFRRSRKLSQ